MRVTRLLIFLATFLLTSCQDRSDRDIETDLSVKVHPTAPEISLRVTDGVVYLSGMVKDSANWRATIEAAKSVQGVKKVEDQLHINLPKKAD